MDSVSRNRAKGKAMSVIFIIVLIVFVGVIVNAGILRYNSKIEGNLLSKLNSAENIAFWVEFSNRPFYGSTADDHQTYLEAHYGLPPVDESNIKMIESFGFKLRAISELTNEASFEGPGMNILSVVRLSFVKRISEVVNGIPAGVLASKGELGKGNYKLDGKGLCSPDSHSCNSDHNLGSFPNSVPISAINIQSLHNNNYNGSGIIIGIIDSGIMEDSVGNRKHETFAGNVSGGGPKIVSEKDFARNDNYADDEIGHGTAVAGLCAGFVSRQTDTGVFNYIGVAPDAQLAIAKVAYEDGKTEHWPDDLYAEAVKWCVLDAQVDIINASINFWGQSFPNNGYNRAARWIDWAVKRGVICCVSAGNSDSTPPGNIYAPGGNFNGITVGATKPDGSQIASYSRVGRTKDKRLKPDVCAPGGISGDNNQNTKMACPFLHSNPDSTDFYAWWYGTSFASPMTAGAIACMFESSNSLKGDPLAVRMRIWETAVDKGVNGPDTVWGFGLLNINSADNAGGYANFLIRDELADSGFVVTCDAGNMPDTSGNSNGVGIYQGVKNGDRAFWTSPDIFVDNNNDGQPDVPNQPIAGQTNKFKVSVRNIGDGSGNATVYLYKSNPNTGMSDWQLLGYNETSIDPDEYDTVSVNWDTPSLNDLGQNHWCIAATVEDNTVGRRDDKRPLPSGSPSGAQPIWNVVKCDNLVIRNFFVRAGGSTDSLYFLCENTTDYNANLTLRDVSTLPDGWNVSYSDTTFSLNINEVKTCTLFVDIPDSAANGDSAFINIEAVSDSGEVIGGIYDVVVKGAAHHFTDCLLTGWTVGSFGAGVFDADPGIFVSEPCGLLASSPGYESAAWGITPAFGLDVEQPYTISAKFIALSPENEGFQVLNNDQVNLQLNYPTELVAIQPSGPPISFGMLNPGMWYSLTVRCYPESGSYDVYLGEMGMGEELVGSAEVLNPIADDFLLLGDTDSLGSGRGECAWDDILVSGTFLPQEVPIVSIEMIPDEQPVEVPPGGSFTFTGILINNTDEVQIVDVWIMLNVPEVGMYGPLQRYNNVHLQPYQVITVPGVVQDVPTYAPLGTYDYISYCGDYPEVKIDSSSFQFTVIPGIIPDGAKNWAVSKWLEDYNPIPLSFNLTSNYPNPFNPSTTIKFIIPEDSYVRLSIYNLLGQVVAIPIDKRMDAGEYRFNWNASGFSSGVYFYKLSAGKYSAVKKMVLIR